ncbi:MAG: 50S ribosomal protein P1 [Nanoarchaeota archaeon]|nr:50S ribosomal protein P1 [Nanoarchaeota archaeon]MBU4241862.1 50S ribosomal protein P1 [Nanoarchaeota archaeon]MBU4352098.1 50S ribosomal protein P1 [Nanoarchaeota archaeon]MBU4456080.1 50S ribosomal protein P1 [Nanoarchaeota archaeon]MCG2719719.1 50S ribosomal protein P1 [Nanoarchaeota archaeon]
MEYIYAGMLLHKAGKEVTVDAVKKVLEAAGVKVDEGRVKALVAALDGVDIEAAIKEAAMAAPVAAPVASAVAPAEAKKEEKKEEEKKDSAAGLGALFG